MRLPPSAYAIVLIAPALLGLGACRQDMHDQPRLDPLEKSVFFEDMRAIRPQVAGTVARGQLRTDKHLYTGHQGDELASTFPFAFTRTDIERGRVQFNVFCSPCHGPIGDGGGIVVQRGFRRPPSYHSERLRQMPPGHFFDVITNGFGAMADFSDRISAEDRWRIAAYIRALQLSQHADIEELPAEIREEFQQAIQP